MTGSIQTPHPTRARDASLIALAAAIAFMLAAANLGEPSLWHDESVHVFVAKNIVETGQPQHNTGVPYFSGTTFNYILAFVIKFWGWGEAAVRSPSVLIGTLNVVLAYIVFRPLLGAPAAIVTAFAMALCPWTVAWSREARFYGLQQLFYLCTAATFWRAIESEKRNPAVAWSVAAAFAYALGLLTAFHSGLFLSGLGIYAGLMLLGGRRIKSRWTLACILIGIAGIATIAVYMALMNPHDRYMVYGQGGIGGAPVEIARSERYYYFNWLRRNLSTGLLVTSYAGFGLMLLREKRRGLYAALLFWLPVLILTFAIGYRRPRFMFFAFPFYLAAASYAATLAAQWLLQPKPQLWQRAAAFLLALFSVRILISALFLIGDSLQAASGADTTLARHHPRWRAPCLYVREQVREDEVILTTTYLPTLYYIGRVDNWYPTRALLDEKDEAGTGDLLGLKELQAYVAQHPKGYFLSHWWRFERNTAMQEERRWVAENMTRLHNQSNADITIWVWGIDHF